MYKCLLSLINMVKKDRFDSKKIKNKIINKILKVLTKSKSQNLSKKLIKF